VSDLNEPRAWSDDAGARRDVSRSALDHLLEGCQVISPDYRYLYVNDAVVRQGRTTKESLLGRRMVECYPGIDATEMFVHLRTCMASRVPLAMENEFAFPDRSRGWFELRFEPVPDGVVILSVDITERKRSELALRRTMRALSTLSRCNQMLVRAANEQVFMDEVCRLIVDAGGYSAAWIELHVPDRMQRSMAARAEAPGQTTGPRFSFDIRARGTVIGALTIQAVEAEGIDDSERALLEEVALDLGHGIETLRARIFHERTESQLIASQRLEAVGRLAGGVAHDFNNLLSVILTYSLFAMEELGADDPIRRDLEQVVGAAERATTLTKQLLAFSRKQILEPVVTNLNVVVEKIESMLRRVLGEDIEFRVNTAGDLGNVLADPGQLDQVIMNLAVNARDAMPKGGKLTIETRNADLDGEYAESHIAVKAGPYVQLSVADTGAGMSTETQSRIFEPFFTTKAAGKGTGLGLSTVYGIVKQSGGNIWVYSEPGRGTTFKIYLPRVDAPLTDHRPPPSNISARGTETILLVEDEASVRAAGERILVAAGYRVITAANGVEALRVAETLDERIDLLLTDVVMPAMSGRDLSERLKLRHPTLRVLFASGYTDEAIVHHGVLEPGTHFLGKPFSGAALTHKVRKVLDET